MLNILFYTPFNSRSRDTESLMQAFVQQGNKVFLLSQTAEGPYHEQCKKLGVVVSAYPIHKGFAPVYFLRHTLYLIRFCRKNKIRLVYAHLENAGLPAVLSQAFIRAKVITCRHTVNEAVLMGSKKFEWLNKLVYRLSRRIIVVSEKSKVWMTEHENIRASKIHLIRLAYNFDLYPKSDPYRVSDIKKKYPSKLLLLTACRMMSGKRPDVSIQVATNLIEKGLDIKLLLLGDGPLLETMQKKVALSGLQDKIFVLGYQSHIMDYLSACDLLVHPSLQDSSSVIIKEAGLCQKAVLTCKNIGDVNEYLQSDKNAFLVSEENTVNEMTETLSEIYEHPERLSQIAQALFDTVKNRFDINTILPAYIKIHSELEEA